MKLLNQFHGALIFLFGFFSFSSLAQLSVTTGLTPSQYVQNLLGAGVSYSNVTYTGSNGQSSGTGRRMATGTGLSMSFDVPVFQIGNFSNGTTTNLNLSAGIILSSGDVRDAAGASIYNPDEEYPYSYTGVNASDANLSSISGSSIYDASVLEFDFVPQGNTIQFKYVFASSEYNTFVNSSYNDAFGFFMSGPGIPGTVNLANIPSTTIPISVNNLNNGYGSCSTGGPSGPCEYCAYFVQNCNGTTITYHAFTTVLTASYSVTCGQTYHIKLAIGDADDSAWDSAVFLENNSFTSNASSNTTQNLNVASCVSTNSVLDPSPITGQPSFTYLWNTGATSSTITVPNGTGPYMVAVTDACGAVDTVNFVINCPLAVTLNNFTVEKQGTTARLNWQTASERNNDYFVIERAGEEGEFSEIYSVKAKGDGNSTTAQNYAGLDSNPLLGINYYRLKSFDQQGVETIVETRSLTFEGDGSLQIIPNPNNGKFSIANYFSGKDFCTIQIFSSNGQLLLSQKIEIQQKGFHQITMDNTDFSPGVYYVQMQTNSKVQISRMLIK
jgi:hypothetical protein